MIKKTYNVWRNKIKMVHLQKNVDYEEISFGNSDIL